MAPAVLFVLLLLAQVVFSQVKIIDSPSDVTACLGGIANFSCFVQFTNGTPSGASWIVNSDMNVSSLNNHKLIDNSSSSGSLVHPVIINNTLVITNTSSIEGSSATYFCQQGNVMSDSATLTVIGPPTGDIIPGIPTSGSGSSNSITLALSYGNANSEDETITGISISWTGNVMGNIILDGNTNSYIIMGLTPSTMYTVTLIAINQCGSGPENTVSVATGDGSGPTGSGPTGSETDPNGSDPATSNPTESSGATSGMKCKIMAFCFVSAVIMMVT